MSTQNPRIAEFFEQHPGVNVCYEALGKPFIDKAKAQAFMAGVAGRVIVTHTRKGVSYERLSDQMKANIAELENDVAQKELAYHNAEPINKEQAMSTWNAAQKKLKDAERKLAKQLEDEEKEEREARVNKPVKVNPVAPKLTKEQLESAIKAQEASVAAAQKLLDAAKKPERKKAAQQKLDKATSDLAHLKKQLEEFQPEPEVKYRDHVVTEEDLVNNPELFGEGVKAGDTVQIPVTPAPKEETVVTPENGNPEEGSQGNEAGITEASATE